jgi:hypothetical protein
MSRCEIGVAEAVPSAGEAEMKPMSSGYADVNGIKTLVSTPQASRLAK